MDTIRAVEIALDVLTHEINSQANDLMAIAEGIYPIGAKSKTSIKYGHFLELKVAQQVLAEHLAALNYANKQLNPDLPHKQP